MTTTPQAALLSEAERCAKNLNKWNANDDCWSPEHIRARSEAELRRLDALVAHLTEDRDDTANELALRTKHNLALTTERDQLHAKLQATQEPAQLPPNINPWDHPERTMRWTAPEIKWIQAYAERHAREALYATAGHDHFPDAGKMVEPVQAAEVANHEDHITVRFPDCGALQGRETQCSIVKEIRRMSAAMQSGDRG